MIIFRQHGNFNNTEKFLKKASKLKVQNILEKYGRQGVSALVAATPKDTGETATSWNYKIAINRYGCRIYFTNSHLHNGVPIAILIQYGHGTGNGGYVRGIDFINPAMLPIFENLALSLWKEVSSL